MDNTILQDLETTLAPYSEKFEWRNDTQLYAYVPVGKLLEAVRTLMDEGWKYLSAITGVDCPAAEGAPAAGGEAEGAVELLYHFCRGALIITLRVRAPYSNPVVPSVCAMIPYATLYERELIEMFGVILEGTPSTDRLFLSDDWPDGVYPLRKSFQGL